MNKKGYYYIIGVVLSLCFCFGSYKLYQYIRIKTAKIEVTLIDDLNLEFAEKRKVSSFIKDINGTIINDYVIDSTTLGEIEVPFEFINDDHIKVKYSYKVKVVDTTSPLIWLGGSYTVKKGSDIDLTTSILCGDNYDNKPKCEVIGEYNLNEEGTYDLVFKATDSCGNTEEQPFTLNVYEPKPSTNESSVPKPEEKTYTQFADIVKNYKTEKTKIGIDVSKFQRIIDFTKIKQAGVEFIIIRVGGTRGPNAKYFLDEQFKRNIKEANKHGIKVGIYFYSYANSLESARKDAKWVLKQIKDYKVDLPIAFDWEEWGSFNEYNLSFFELTSIAEAFLGEIEKQGYQGMLYSSKTYLDYIWLPTKYDIWLAHYTDKTNYQGKYKFWQLCDNGKVDGIDTAVDIDIMYK